MADENEDIKIDEIIDELDNTEDISIADRAMLKFPEFYTQFKQAFRTTDEGHPTTREQKNEMVMSTYSVALDSLNTAMNALEYSYTLSKAIEKISKEEELEQNEFATRAIKIANSYIEQLASSANLNINSEVSAILKEMQSKKEFYE